MIDEVGVNLHLSGIAQHFILFQSELFLWNSRALWLTALLNHWKSLNWIVFIVNLLEVVHNIWEVLTGHGFFCFG